MMQGWTWEDTPQAWQTVADRLAAARSPVLATQGRRFHEVVEIATAGKIQRPGGGNA